MSILPPTAGAVPEAFWKRLAGSAETMLLLDYDGTLAPFQVRREEARPWPGVIERLEQIGQHPRGRVVVISGREAEDVAGLLQPFRPSAVWGVHGLVRRGADGREERQPVPPDALAALDEAARVLGEMGWQGQCERKHGAVALHWRGLGEASRVRIEASARTRFAPLAASGRLQVREFDGGIELRADGPHKGDAVLEAVSTLPDGSAFAYLGDDLTDEDAFRAILGLPDSRGGLTVLVRTVWRETAARVWIRPPEGLVAFLSRWKQVLAQEDSAWTR